MRCTLRHRWLLAIAAGLALPALAPRVALAQTAPAGWSRTDDAKAKTITLKPDDLKSGDLLMVRFYSREDLNGQSLDQWLDAQLRSRKPPSGKWAGEGWVQKQSANFASATRSFRDDANREGFIMLTAVSVDGQSARMAALVSNSMDAMNRHKDAAMKAVGQIMELEKFAAVNEDRGLKLEATPPAVKGIKPGGPLKPGRYKGNMITTWDNKVLRPVEVLIFDNGEFGFIQGEQWRDESGTYTYSPATGRFQAQDPLYNSSYDPDEDFCIYGTEADGTSVIYAEDDAGTSIHKTRLRRIGPVDRDPPTVVAQRKKEAEEEAARYKFVVEPGQGVKDDEIECVLSVVEYVNDGVNSNAKCDAYLLMKDGRVMDGLPVAPNELDLAKSRSQEPDRWGFWRRNANQYEFAWPSRPNDYQAPKGFQSVGRPVPRDTKLDADYKGASSWGIIGGAGGANFWGVRFSPKGRFEKWKRGIAGTGTPVFEGQTTVGTAYDDEGASTVVSGGNIGGGTTVKHKDADAGRMGWYEFNGYSLTLKYDNGKVVRLPTFISSNQSAIWFEGRELALERPDK
jgi:hypothetical protein